MAITITEDLILGANYHFVGNMSGAVGEMVRIFFVEGLTPASDTVFQAANAVDSVTGFRIPQYRKQHERVGNLFVSDIFAEPWPRDSQSKAKVTLTYSTPQHGALSIDATIRVMGSTIQEPVDRDPNTGKVLTVSYKDVTTGDVATNTVNLTVARPRALVEFTRIEPGSPLLKSLKFNGTVNATPWQKQPPLKWMCKSISGESVGIVNGATGAVTYLVRYLFEFAGPGKYDDFTEFYFYRDNTTNEFPRDAQPSRNNDKGIYTFTPVQQNFNVLRLPNAF